MTHAHLLPFVVLATSFLGAACSAPSEAEAPAAEQNVQADEDALVSRNVSLKIPVVDESGKFIARFNTLLRRMGEAPMPEYVVVSNTTGAAPFNALVDRWDSLYHRVSARAGIMRAFTTPSEYVVTGAPTKRLCYTGNPYYLGGLLQSLSDSVMSDQFYLVGWKSGRGVFVQSDMREYSSEFPADWASYSTARRDVMVLFVTNDSGDDFETNAIPRCAP